MKSIKPKYIALVDDGTTVPISRRRTNVAVEFFFARLAEEAEGGS